MPCQDVGVTFLGVGVSFKDVGVPFNCKGLPFHRGSIFIWGGRRKEKSGRRIHKINVSRPENVGCCRRVEKCWILGSLRCKKMAFQLRPLFLTNVMERFELHIKSKDRGGNVPP